MEFRRPDLCKRHYRRWHGIEVGKRLPRRREHVPAATTEATVRPALQVEVVAQPAMVEEPETPEEAVASGSAGLGRDGGEGATHFQFLQQYKTISIRTY